MHLSYNTIRNFVSFLQNSLVSDVYFWSAKLLQISHIITSMFSGIIIVTVNLKKTRSNKGNFFPKTLEINL